MAGSGSTEDAFRRIFESHYEAVYRYALRRVGEARAADVTAEVFVVAWRRFEQIPDVVRPWLYGVARLTVANEVSRCAS